MRWIELVAADQNCGLIDEAHTCLTLLPSSVEITPILPIKSDCSRQSSRDKRTVDANRSPERCQSANSTSNVVRGFALVTAATTASDTSSQRTNTGRFLV